MKRAPKNAVLSRKERQSKDKKIRININQVPDLLDLLWFAFSEANPQPFRAKALEFIRFIENQEDFQHEAFTGRKEEWEEGCLCNQ